MEQNQETNNNENNIDETNNENNNDSEDGNNKEDVDDENNTITKGDNNKKKKKEKEPSIPFSRLFSYATPVDKILIALGAIAAAGSGVVMPGLIILIGTSFNALTGDVNELYDKVSEAALYMTILGIAAFIANGVNRVCWSYTSERQVEAMRIDYLKSILRQDISYFDKTGTGTLTSSIVSNTQLMQEAIGEKFGMVIQYFSTFAAGIIIGFVFQWKLTLVVLSVFPLMAGVGGAVTTIFAKAETQTQAAYAGAGAIANESIAGMRTIQSFNLHNMILEKYRVKIEEAKKVAVKKGLLSGLAIGSIYFIFFGTYSLAFWYGGKLYMSGDTKPGDILIVILSVIIASFVLGTMATNLDAVAKGIGAGTAFFAIIDRKSDIDSSDTSGLKPDDYDGSLYLENAHFRYPTRQNQKVLDGINLTIPAGSKVALVGPSGSGKSSIIQLLQRFYDPEDGSVCLGDYNLKDLNVAWLRYQFGIVGQEPALFSGSIKENIAFGCHESVTQEQIEAAAKAALAHNFIQTFPEGYGTQVGERGAQLSGGQKQRIAIARAILKNPKILLLDEATSALDSRSEKKVQRALDNAAEGRTTVIIAHRLSTVRNADIIAVISKGVLVESGSHDELIAKNGVYANLVRIQLGGIDQSEAKQEEEEEEDDQIEVVVKEEAEPEEIKVQKAKFPWRSILKMSRPEAKQIIFGAIGSIIIGVINPIQALFFARIFNAYTLPANQVMDELRPWLIVYVGLGVGMLTSYALQGYFFGYAGQQLVFRCRLQSLQSILKQEIGWFDKKENSTGALTGKLATEAAQVEGAIGAPLGSLFTSAAAIITGLIIAYIYSWRLAWVLTLAFPCILFGGFTEMYATLPNNTNRHEAMLNANTVATEAISNVRTVASYVNEERMIEKYSEELLKPREKAVKNAIILGLLVGLGQFAKMGVNALGFWYGAKLIRDGDLNFGDFLAAFQGLIFASESVSIALTTSTSFTKASSGAKHIFALINRVPLINSQSESGELIDRETVSGNIEFRNVEFAYPTRPDSKILQNLNLEIKPNQVTALVGASGCGKSSCIGLIERWYDPAAGKVLLDGVDVKKYNIQWLRNTIALVGQEPVLFSGTIAENIGYSIQDATMEQIEEAAKSANAHNFISQFPDGYRTQVGEKGAQLSGGQKQRIAIARAIIKKPVVLLLDEATSALDTESEEVVQQALDNVMQGLTTVVIAHRLSTIRRADHIAVIDYGQVVEEGSHSELMQLKGHYFQLVQAQTS